MWCSACQATSRTWAKIRESGGQQMLNRAIRGLYPPGSTFKMVTAAAALEAGVIDLKTRIPCDGQVELGGQVFRCWKRSGHGPCDLHRGLKESCDCYFYEAARRVHFVAMAALVGFVAVHLAMVALVPRTLRTMVLGR